MMQELHDHYGDDGVVELVAVISLFGFFNRWNDTMSTDLEAGPGAFAAGHLDGTDWVLKPGTAASSWSVTRLQP